MDAEDAMPVSGNVPDYGNGLHEQLPSSKEEGVVLEKVNGSLTSSTEIESLSKNSEDVTAHSTVPAKNDVLTVSKEIRVKETDELKHSKMPRVVKNAKIGKPSSPKNAAAMSVRKSKDGKDMHMASSVSNGSINAHLSKQSGKSNAASSTVKMEESEGLVEKTKPKPLRKGPLIKAEGSTHSSSSPTSEDARSQRFGTLPNYSFSFRCYDRAEKRKEFYSKIEEKIHAKEMERSNLQAKTKETQEAEIKQLRKSLTFKATPMPSFYQEPEPPKAELKKIPTTRAKSPKLGRKKNSPTGDAEGNTVRIYRPGRLSLDEKMSQNNPAKGPSPVHVKKPLRKSLPKLPSEKTNLSRETYKVPSRKTNEVNEAASQQNTSNEANEAASHHIEEQEAAPAAELSQTLPNTDEITVVEDQPQTIFVQEPIALQL